MIADLNEVKEDIAAFADDDNDVIVDTTGQILFYRAGQEISCRIGETPDGAPIMTIGDQQLGYRRFVSHYLARLDLLADKFLAKRTSVQAFVNGPASSQSTALQSIDGSALELLDRECSDVSPFAARVIFVTADAGQGKTVLLREYQALQAKKFLAGTSQFLFWHVDLQGRQLLRLSEALMGDLGDLRVTGIFMPSILRLLRHRVLILAIDGFDELAAEQGSTDALGALAQLVKNLADKGTIVAASRRTFFDTEDYLSRTDMLRKGVSTRCEFDQIHLRNWSRTEGISYLSQIEIEGKHHKSPESTYRQIVAELGGNESHPMVSRPFLLAHVSRALLRYNITPATFIRGMQDPMTGAAAVVGAFLQREVTEKWKSKDTGDPYLTAEQHMRLLATMAEEMWQVQKDRLPLEVVESLTVLLLDEWHIPQERRRQVTDMVRMHVLLNIPRDGDARSRSFDHPEFRNYFLAWAIVDSLQIACQKDSVASLGRLLSVAQLPDTTARYAASIGKGTCEPTAVIEILAKLVRKEWRPTYLQSNAGTLIPYLLDRLSPEVPLHIDAKAVYPSVVFEKTVLKNIDISNGIFLNTNLSGVAWENVRLHSCDLEEVGIDTNASFLNVTFEDCQLSGVRQLRDGEEIGREYSPLRISQLLQSHGIRVVENAQTVAVTAQPAESENRKFVRRLLQAFRRSTVLPENILLNFA